MTVLSQIGPVQAGNLANASPTPPKSGSEVRAAASAKAPDSLKLSADGAERDTPTKALVETAVEEVKKAVATVARNLQFSVDEDTGKTVIKVVDAASRQVIRQIPSPEMLEIAKAFKEMADKPEGEKPPMGLLLTGEA